MATIFQTAEQVYAALQLRYPSNQWGLFPQVRNATGYQMGGTPRTADAMALNVWPSQGMPLHGIEIKVSRSDVLSELKKPEKSDPLAKYCHQWWLAVGSKALVDPSELPPTWGLLVPHGKGLRVAKKAQPMDPVPLDRAFVASLLRSAQEALKDEGEMKKRLVVEYLRGQADGKAGAKATVESAQMEVDATRRAIQEFQDRSGLHISAGYFQRGIHLGDAVRMIRQGGLDRQRQEMCRLVDTATEIADFVLKAVHGLEGVTNDGDSAGTMLEVRRRVRDTSAPRATRRGALIRSMAGW